MGSDPDPVDRNGYVLTKSNPIQSDPMARERGYFTAAIGPWIWSPFVTMAVISGLMIGMFLVIGGIMYDPVILIIRGIILWMIWIVLLWAVSVLFDDAVNWVDERFPETPEDEGKEYFWDFDTGRPTSWGRSNADPHPVPLPRAPMRPEPGTCTDCGGMLFLGRESCPHCGSPVIPQG